MPSRVAPSREKAYQNLRYQIRTAQKKAAPPAQSLDDVEAMLRFAETLTVPQGLRAGMPLILQQWQVDWLRGAMAKEVRQAGLSVARKNGKSSLIAMCCLYWLTHVQGFRGIVVSLDGDRARNMRQMIEEFYEASGMKNIKFRGGTTHPGDCANEIIDSSIKFLTASEKKSQGWAVHVAIVDEIGLMDGDKEARLIYGMQSSLSTQPNNKFLGISVKGNSEAFADIESMKDDPAVFWKEFSCPQNADLQDERAWEMANPGLDVIKSRENMAILARKARRNPDIAREFQAFDLNMPIDPGVDLILRLDEWHQYCEVIELPPKQGSVCVGIDLGQNVSMTAAAFYWYETGRLEVFVMFPESPTLSQRGRDDNVGSLYQQMYHDGELLLAGMNTTDLDVFIKEVAQRVGGARVYMSSDRWRDKELSELMFRHNLRWQPNYRGQGWKDGAEDVRAFRRMAYEGKIKCLPSKVARHAIMESNLKQDDAGNYKIVQRRHNGRIDAIKAMVLAVSQGKRMMGAPQQDSLILFSQ